MKALAHTVYILKKYPYTISLTLLVTSIIVLLFGIIRNSRKGVQEVGKSYEVIQCDRSKYATAPISSIRLMKDLNETQLLHAKANGLNQIYITNKAFLEDSASLVSNHILKRIADNPLYKIKSLTHSYPYVTLEMADLLDKIAIAFKAKLKAKNIDHYVFYITSALRTSEFQEDLTGRNRNATNESAHLYGATVDISYKEFYNTETGENEQSYEAGDALRETMLDLREACRLLVVRERRQACYHFTVVNCDPEKSPITIE